MYEPYAQLSEVHTHPVLTLDKDGILEKALRSLVLQDFKMTEIGDREFEY